MTRQEQKLITQEKKEQQKQITQEKKEQTKLTKSFDKLIEFAKRKGAWVEIKLKHNGN